VASFKLAVISYQLCANGRFFFTCRFLFRSDASAMGITEANGIGIS
jgi:hypothetical protein